MAVAEVRHYPAGTPGSGNVGDAATFTLASVNPSGGSAILLMIGWEGWTTTITAVTCGNGMTCAGGNIGTLVKDQHNNPSNSANSAVYVFNAPVGTGDLVVTFSTTTQYAASAIVVSGSDPSTPCPTGDAVAAMGDGVNPIVVTPSNLTSNDMAAGLVTHTSNQGANPHWSTGTEVYFDTSTATLMSAGYHLGTGSVTGTASSYATSSIMVAVRVVSAVGGGGGAAYNIVLGEPTVAGGVI